MKTFKRPLVLVPLVLTLLAGLAFAQNRVLTAYNLAGASTSAAPSGASAGLAVIGAPQSVRALTVTVSDVRDGGGNDSLDVVAVAREEAWCYFEGSLSPDGGGGWQRMPELDLYLDAGATSGIVDDGVPQGVAGKVTLPTGLPCPRIYYNTATLNLGWDAGTGLVHRVSIVQTQ